MPYFTPKPSNWNLVAIALGCFGLLLVMNYACTAPRVQVENPPELCAQALGLSSEIRAQASKVGLEPIELARRTCEAAILAARLAEANLSAGVAGRGTQSEYSDRVPAAAGAAGSGG